MEGRINKYLHIHCKYMYYGISHKTVQNITMIVSLAYLLIMSRTRKKSSYLKLDMSIARTYGLTFCCTSYNRYIHTCIHVYKIHAHSNNQWSLTNNNIVRDILITGKLSLMLAIEKIKLNKRHHHSIHFE